MSYKNYFKIEGDFILPQNFFIPEYENLIKFKESEFKISEIENLGLEMTLKQQIELKEMKEKGFSFENPYGFRILIPFLTKEESFQWLKNRDKEEFSKYDFVYLPHLKRGYILLRNDDAQVITFVKFKNIFAPTKSIEETFTDNKCFSKCFIEDIVQELKLSITISDTQDEDSDFQEFYCCEDKDTEEIRIIGPIKTIYINGIKQEEK